MKRLKTILKYLLFAIIGLVLALAVMPFVFKDKIVQFIKEDINQSIKATMTFSDIDLSIFKSFPSLRISIDSLSLIGQDEFQDITLYKAAKTSVDVNLSSLFGDQIVPEINAILLDKPEINIIILDSLTTNYNISRDTVQDDTVQKYHFSLKKYDIEDGKISYQDNTMPMFVVLDHFDHKGSGDFTQDIFDLKTTSKIGELFVKYDGTTYMNHFSVDMDANIHIDWPNSKYTLKDNTLRINDLDLKGDGFLQLKDDDIITDVVFETASEDFKSLLSILPNAYTEDFENVKSSGKASFKGKINGTYNSTKQLLPVFDISVKVDNGYFKYPQLPQDVKDLFADIQIKTTRPDYKDLTINIPAFRMKLGNDQLSGKLIANNLTGDQRLEGNIKGVLNLKNLATAFPIKDLVQLSGILNADLSFKAKMSDVNAEHYNAIHFDGSASASKVVYQSKDMPIVKIDNAVAKASPKIFTFTSNNMQLGHSDLKIDAAVVNPLAMLSTEKQMQIDIKGRSTYFDMDEWSAPSTPTTNENIETAPVSNNEEIIQKSNMKLDLAADKVKLNGYTLQNFNLAGDLATNAMHIQEFSTTVDGNDIALTGNIYNAYDYFFNNGMLEGKLQLTSKKMDLNKFMTTTASTSEAPMSVIPVPDKVRLLMSAHIDDLTYTNIRLKNFSGDLSVENREVAMTNLTSNFNGGSIGMEGLYSTADMKNPDFAFKLNLSKIKFVDAFNTFETFKKAAPIAEFMNGIFNTTLVMKGKLGSEMMPIWTSMDASGFLETLHGTLNGFGPLNQLWDKLGISSPKVMDLTNTKNWFEIVQGYVDIKEFTKNIGDVKLTMAGKHGLDMGMDYNIDLVIPRELLKKNAITGTVESGLSLLEKDASKLGLNLQQGPNIFVNVKMTGTMKQPNFKITPKGSGGSSLQDEIGQKAEDTFNSIKDSIAKEAKKHEEKLKDTLTKRANEELDKLKQKAEEKSKKVVDSLKSKAEKDVISKIDSLTKGIIPDSLKQKIEEKAGSELDKIKNKLDEFNPFKKKKKN